MIMRRKPKLERISPVEVSIGMYVHGFSGSWISHPFWRAHFLIEDAATLHKIRGSGVEAVIIDVERGAPVSSPERAKPAPAATRHATLTAAERAGDKLRALGVVRDAKLVVRDMFERARTGEVDLPAMRSVVESLSDALSDNRPMLLSVLSIKTKDEYTYLHSVAVSTLMINLARRLELDEATVEAMGVAGLFHDIGKIGIPEPILNKPGRLTEAEFAEMRGHPRHGHALLSRIEGLSPIALDVCLHHHERVDGAGYPFGLTGDQISLAARMGAICDVYDALTSVRPYKGPVAPIAALAAMRSWQGHFDGDLLFMFMRSIGCFPTGMLLSINGTHLAVVRDNGRRSRRPRLKIFYELATGRFVPPYEHHLSDNVHGTLLAEAHPAEHGLDDWPRLRAELLGHDGEDSARRALKRAIG